MSVMVLNESEYAQLYQFLCNKELENLNGQNAHEILGEQKTNLLLNVFRTRHLGTVNHLYNLNVLNYCIKYNEDFIIDKVNLDIPVLEIDKREALEIVRSIRYNICDNFDTDDADYLIQYIENNF